MFGSFTDRARKVMAFANQEVQDLNHEYIGTEHILVGLIKESSGVAHHVLDHFGVTCAAVQEESKKLVRLGPQQLENLIDMITMGRTPQSPRTKRMIEFAIEEARNLKHNCVGTEHLLLGLLREHEGVGAQILMNLKKKLDDIRKYTLEMLEAMLVCGEGEVKTNVVWAEKEDELMYKRSPFYFVGEADREAIAMRFVSHFYKIQKMKDCLTILRPVDCEKVYVFVNKHEDVAVAARIAFQYFKIGLELDKEA